MATLAFLHPELEEVLDLLAYLIENMSRHLLRIVFFSCHMILTYSSQCRTKLMI